jgi:hypothetical protein
MQVLRGCLSFFRKKKFSSAGERIDLSSDEKAERFCGIAPTKAEDL